MIWINLEFIHSFIHLNQTREKERERRGSRRTAKKAPPIYRWVIAKHLNFHSARAWIVSRPFHFVSMFSRNIFVLLFSAALEAECWLFLLVSVIGTHMLWKLNSLSLSLLVSTIFLMFEWFIVIFLSSTSILMWKLHLCQQ